MQGPCAGDASLSSQGSGTEVPQEGDSENAFEKSKAGALLAPPPRSSLRAAPCFSEGFTATLMKLVGVLYASH